MLRDATGPSTPLAPLALVLASFLPPRLRLPSLLLRFRLPLSRNRLLRLRRFAARDGTPTVTTARVHPGSPRRSGAAETPGPRRRRWRRRGRRGLLRQSGPGSARTAGMWDAPRADHCRSHSTRRLPSDEADSRVGWDRMGPRKRKSVATIGSAPIDKQDSDRKKRQVPSPPSLPFDLLTHPISHSCHTYPCHHHHLRFAKPRQDLWTRERPT